MDIYDNESSKIDIQLAPHTEAYVEYNYIPSAEEHLLVTKLADLRKHCIAYLLDCYNLKCGDWSENSCTIDSAGLYYNSIFNIGSHIGLMSEEMMIEVFSELYKAKIASEPNNNYISRFVNSFNRLISENNQEINANFIATLVGITCVEVGGFHPLDGYQFNKGKVLAPNGKNDSKRIKVDSPSVLPGGPNYYARGFIQLVGEGNYRAITNCCKNGIIDFQWVDLIRNPNLLSTNQNSIEANAAMVYYYIFELPKGHGRNMAQAMNNGDTFEAYLCVNPGAKQGNGGTWDTKLQPAFNISLPIIKKYIDKHNKDTYFTPFTVNLTDYTQKNISGENTEYGSIVLTHATYKEHNWNNHAYIDMNKFMLKPTFGDWDIDKSIKTKLSNSRYDSYPGYCAAGVQRSIRSGGAKMANGDAWAYFDGNGITECGWECVAEFTSDSNKLSEYQPMPGDISVQITQSWWNTYKGYKPSNGGRNGLGSSGFHICWFSGREWRSDCPQSRMTPYRRKTLIRIFRKF